MIMGEISGSPIQKVRAHHSNPESKSFAPLKISFLSSRSQQYIKKNWGTLFFIYFLFIISFLLRWGYINGTFMITPIRADAWSYFMIAYNLAEHGAYSTDTGPDVKSSPTARDPGYPFFLAGIVKLSDSVDDFFLKTCWIQSILGALTVVISYFLARLFLPSLWSGAVSILTMLSPHLISMTNYVLTETLFTFLLLLGMVLYLFALRRKSSWLLISSCLTFGFAICVRSVFQLYPVLLAAMGFFLFRHERKNATRHAIIILMTSFIFFAPWKVWSHFTFKGMESQSLLKDVLYVGSYKGLIYNGIPKSQLQGGIGMPYRDDPNYENVINEGYIRIFKEIGRRFMENPIGYSSWWLFGKPVMFWGWNIVDGGGDIHVYPSRYTWYDKNKLMNLTKIIMRFLHPVIIILMHFGAILFILRRKNYTGTQYIMMSTILMLLFYFAAIHIILTPAPRYSIPLRPLTYFMAIFSIAELIGKAIRKEAPISKADE